MYIEKLSEEDIEKFASLFDSSVSKVENLEDKELYLQLFTGKMGPQPEMWLSDFDLRTSIYYKDAEKRLKSEYIHFMNDKFDGYYADYTANYNMRVEEDRII